MAMESRNLPMEMHIRVNTNRGDFMVGVNTIGLMVHPMMAIL